MKIISESKRRILTALFIFLCVMLFCTFISQTVYYHITPKVFCQSIRSGRLHKNYFLMLSEASGEFFCEADMYGENYFREGEKLSFDINGEKREFTINNIENTGYNTRINLSAETLGEEELETVRRGAVWRSVSATTSAFDNIIPKTSLVNGMFVYAAANSTSIMGERQTVFAVKVEVICDSNQEYAIRFASPSQAKEIREIAASWDREIYDGDYVIVLRR